MKRIVSILLTAVIVLSVMPLSVVNVLASYSGTCGDNLDWTLDDDGTLTVSGTGAMYDYQYSPYAPWYYNKNSIKNIVIENGVTGIGKMAFQNCYNLSQVTIGNGVALIGDSAFSSCSNLKKVYYKGEADSWVKIDFSTANSNPLYYGAELYFNGALANDLFLSPGVTEIKSFAFYGYENAKSVMIPNGVKSIGTSAFDRCINLTEITIPQSVTTVGDYAFSNCTNLAELTFGGGVTQVGKDAFNFCEKLETVYYEGNVSSWLKIDFSTLYSNPLYYGPQLYFEGNLAEDIVIPSGITEIKNYAFCGYKQGKLITLPNGLTKIGDYALYNWQELSEITLPESLETIGKGVFSCCYALTEIAVPQNATAIGDSAFYNCINLAEITFGDSLTSIGAHAFEFCKKLKTVNYKGDISSWLKIEFSDSNSLPNGANLYFEGELAENIVIPSGISEIKNYAFCSCASIKSVSIPEGVTSIGTLAFFNCENLANLNLPESLINVGLKAFNGCAGLAEVTIPKNVTSIENYAFSNCPDLKEVHCYESSDKSNWSKNWIDNSVAVHTIDDSVTCTEDQKCIDCGEVFVPAKGKHKEGEWEIAYEAGEYTNGLKQICCTACDKRLKYEVIPATVIMPGDMTGDKSINALDYAKLKRYCMNKVLLTETELIAADVNRNGTINAVDYSFVKRHCMGAYIIR